jgi:hypothetical protein
MARSMLSRTSRDKFLCFRWISKTWSSSTSLVGERLTVCSDILKKLMFVDGSIRQSLEQAVEIQRAAERLKREIDALEAIMKKERQFNRKVEQNLKLQEKRKELEKILKQEMCY